MHPTNQAPLLNNSNNNNNNNLLLPTPKCAFFRSHHFVYLIARPKLPTFADSGWMEYYFTNLKCTVSYTLVTLQCTAVHQFGEIFFEVSSRWQFWEDFRILNNLLGGSVVWPCCCNSSRATKKSFLSHPTTIEKSIRFNSSHPWWKERIAKY